MSTYQWRWGRRAKKDGFGQGQGALKSYIALGVLALVTSLASPTGPQRPGLDLGAGASRVGVSAPTSYLTARTGQEFANDVLAVAPLPVGARAWHGRLPAGLAEPPTLPGPAIDRYRVYLASAASVSRLRQYVPAHLGGATWVSSGSGSPPTPDSVEFSLAVVGPHEYSATLSYAMVALGGGGCLGQDQTGAPCVLRVDAIALWEPSRPPNEVAPLRDKVVLSAYSAVSVVITRPVFTYTVSLRPAQSRDLIAKFDSLPLGPGASCHEGAVLYELAVKPPSGQGPVFEVTGQQCAAVVDVSVGGRPLHSLSDRDCALLDLVRRFAPVKAIGTRSAEAGCAQLRPRRPNAQAAPAIGTSRRSLRRRPEEPSRPPTV